MPKVAWVPKEAAKKITVPTNVISIRGPYDSYPTFAVKHKRVLSLSFNPFDTHQSESMKEKEFTPALCREVFAFMESCQGEDILVHCGEGRIRSPAVAFFIAEAYDRTDEPVGGSWTPDFKHPDRKFSDAGMDRQLWRMLKREWQLYNEEKKEQHELPDQS